MKASISLASPHDHDFDPDQRSLFQRHAQIFRFLSAAFLLSFSLKRASHCCTSKLTNMDSEITSCADDRPLTSTFRASHATAHNDSKQSRHNPIARISDSRARSRRSTRRSVSAHTASDIQEESDKASKWRQRRHAPVTRQSADLPVSEDPIQRSKRLHRRRLGYTTVQTIYVASSVADEEEKQPILKTPPSSSLTSCSRVVSDSGYAVSPAARSDRVRRTNLLLDLARRSIEIESDWVGRRPCVMDVILDLRDLGQNSALEALLLLLNHGGASNGDPYPSYYRTYDFSDERSLVAYWADQSVLWSGMRVRDNTSNAMGFPVSLERSTARWDATALNCESDEVTSVSGGPVSVC
ncbi:unnamed protein product [Cyclocybe aegerita]|uniref:Uncharacterized protein n=1 Tax=Cyclocybe aegerita TaxID=1973307 RepID=A0A8S0VX33_CYCAE|nr:unnamed protein product [Cyclocybe aegerita]